MKICENCGTSNNDDSLYCISCGKELDATNSSSQTFLNQQNTNNTNAPGYQQEQNQQQPYFNEQPMENPYTYAYSPVQGNPNTLQSIRELLSSPMTLTVAVLMAVQVLFSIIVSFMSTAMISSNSQLENLIQKSSLITSATTSVIITLVPTALIIIGLIMIYQSAKKMNSPMSTSGFTIIRVLSIISLILVCIAVAIMFLVSFVFIGGGNAFANELLSEFDLRDFNGLDMNAIFSVIGIVLIIVTILFGALGISFLASVIKFLSSLSQTFATGYPSAKGAGAFSVFCFIFGGFTVLCSFAVFLNMLNPALCLLNFITIVINAAVYFILGTIASKYKKIVNMY